MLRSSLSVEPLEARDVPAALIFSDLLVSSYADQKVEPQGYLEITLTDVIISSYQTSGSDSASGQPMESLALNYTKVTY
jgi:hypothetical protein